MINHYRLEISSVDDQSSAEQTRANCLRERERELSALRFEKMHVFDVFRHVGVTGILNVDFHVTRRKLAFQASSRRFKI